MLQRLLFNNKKSTTQSKPQANETDASNNADLYKDKISRLSYIQGYSTELLDEVERNYSEMERCYNSKLILKEERCYPETARFFNSHDRYTSSRHATTMFHGFVFENQFAKHQSDEIRSLKMQYSSCMREINLLAKLSLLAQEHSSISPEEQQQNAAAIEDEYSKCNKILMAAEDKSKVMKLKQH